MIEPTRKPTSFHLSNLGCLLFFVVLSISCADEKQNRSLYIQKKYEHKVNQYIKQRRNTCQLEAFEKIHQEVDSLMYFLVQKKRQTNPEMPERPKRPARLVDTIKLETKQE